MSARASESTKRQYGFKLKMISSMVNCPWVVDLLPTASWLQLIFGLSLLFNAMLLWHRFQLWRIDAHRLCTEGAISLLFGAGVTVAEITPMPPSAQPRPPEARGHLETVMDQLATLSDRCRRHSLSMLGPMGQEFAYRY